MHIWLIWRQCYVWLGVVSMDHNDSCYHFLQSKLGRASESVNDVWGALWIAVVSEIWKHKSKVIFKGGVVDVSEIFTIVQLKVW